jgi:hypothetical protein
MFRVIAAAIAFATALAPLAVAAQDTRAAIIDTPWDTRPFIADLRAAGVAVIGRYYARCPQPERFLPEKRLVDQGGIGDARSEVRQLLDNGFAILSIYQYNNDSANKFRGMDRDGKPLKGADCQPASRARTAAEEGELDANAAVAQAKAVGQPRGTAIYFGVDIRFDKGDAATRRAMLDYMRTVRGIVTRAGYTVGAYGNGDALEVLAEERLIEHGWLSASRSYPGTSRVHNSGRWQLFQSGVDLVWFSGTPGACRSGLALDVNIQNARFADRSIGFWTRRGAATVSPARTRAIYAARRFACDGNARIRRTATSGPRDLLSATPRCVGRRTARHPETVDYGNSARIGRLAGDLVEIDHDDDGTFDGWTALGNLTPSFDTKPAWIFSKDERNRARCP